ncbi:hypothetical protein DIV08_31300 [Escherichia coli]|nr:hypothetical protein DIV08_31300 [Escherichia coli]
MGLPPATSPKHFRERTVLTACDAGAILGEHLIKRVSGLGPRCSYRRYRRASVFFCIGIHAHLINGGLYGATFG